MGYTIVSLEHYLKSCGDGGAVGTEPAKGLESAEIGQLKKR